MASSATFALAASVSRLAPSWSENNFPILSSSSISIVPEPIIFPTSSYILIKPTSSLFSFAILPIAVSTFTWSSKLARLSSSPISLKSLVSLRPPLSELSIFICTFTTWPLERVTVSVTLSLKARPSPETVPSLTTLPSLSTISKVDWPSCMPNAGKKSSFNAFKSSAPKSLSLSILVSPENFTFTIRPVVSSNILVSSDSPFSLPFSNLSTLSSSLAISASICLIALSHPSFALLISLL